MRRCISVTVGCEDCGKAYRAGQKYEVERTPNEALKNMQERLFLAAGWGLEDACICHGPRKKWK